jgi:hypothetical protein
MSQNLYWLAADSASYRQLTRLAPADMTVNANSVHSGDTVRVHVQLHNSGSTVALENKLTLVNAGDGSRILPAYFSDNYVSLLPGESREIEIEYPSSARKGPAAVGLRGWNLASRTTNVIGDK